MDGDWLRTHEQGGPPQEVGTHFLFGVQELFGPVETVSVDVGYAGPELSDDDVVADFVTGDVRGTVDPLCDHEIEEESLIIVVGEE